ncbi:Sexual differentiation process protein-like protein [Emericellopsis cladophorae]|uniref:Sexual differentiation process protein-like protein n=1 Tax=Emericellopsis cladophorae TaxID=2686198 RepID=A0A9P9Y5F6_9HYPO|nr:Sexual differentiation process protein-like protein [Emericellopsis cladophorae]KAI6783852.1 Sexual differentiation process protein-like protein [Emericellopsis cladophorae]
MGGSRDGHTSALELGEYPTARTSASEDRERPSGDASNPYADTGLRNDEDEGSEDELLLDPNLPDDPRERRRSHAEEAFVAGGEDADGKAHEAEDSPYPEVRAAVRNYDEDLPCNTLRAWTIGLMLVVLGASMNTLFSLRQPSISVGPLIAQIISWPMGHGWHRFMPEKTFYFRGKPIPLNPGPFNIKEHSIVVVMAGVSFSVAYATDIILAQLVFYKQDFGMLFQLLLTISTQSLGYGIAGMMRRFLVYPASMIWPGNLVSVTLLNAMHETNDTPDPTVLGGSMPRYRWFGLVTVAAFFYYFIPGFLAQFLSVFAFATWLAPQNAVVNQLFGGQTGLSLLPITFDWTQIAGYVGSPLIPPWHAIANTLVGVIVFFCFGSAVLHFNGAWYGNFLPMSDSNTYDNMGNRYDTSRILTADFTLDEAAYKNYSPLFISTTFAMSYGLSFAAISSLIVYTYLHNRKQIWKQYRNSTTESPDIHMKLMQKYKEAPTWWYMSLFGLMLLLGFVTVLAYPTNLTWWAFLLAVAISFGFSLPIGIIEAITNNRIGLNVLTEFIYGYIQPGRPLALMIFKTFGYITMSQALSFVGDLKFGHYMKIPPRTMFMAQVVATTFSCFIQILVLNLALGSIPNVCEPDQADHFTCPGGRVFFAASVIWGLIGPDRMFSPGSIYSGLFVFFVIGAVVPVGIYFAIKRWPKSPIRYAMAPIIFGGAGAIPPATPLNYLSWGIVGFIFQFWIKKRHFAWWSRLNFLTSSGLDLGLALATLFIFFAFTMHEIEPPQWWGNTVVDSTMDMQGTAIQVKVMDGQTRFGPDVW